MSTTEALAPVDRPRPRVQARAARPTSPAWLGRAARGVGGSLQVVRSVVTQAGPQVTGVTVSEGLTRSVPVLHVRAGAVFVYAGAPQVVAAYVAAWRDSLLAAGQVFGPGPAAGLAGPAAGAGPGAVTGGEPQQQVAGSEVSVIVRHDSVPAGVVSCYPTERTRPGRPAYVETVTGPLTVRSLDRTAILDQLAVWLHAAALGALVWASPALADL